MPPRRRGRRIYRRRAGGKMKPCRESFRVIRAASSRGTLTFSRLLALSSTTFLVHSSPLFSARLAKCDALEEQDEIGPRRARTSHGEHGVSFRNAATKHRENMLSVLSVHKRGCNLQSDAVLPTRRGIGAWST